MGFGALGGQFPIRLGPASGEETGLTAAQHARLCADLVALNRVQPIGTWRYSQDDVEVLSYSGWNGYGLAFAPDAAVVEIEGTNHVVFSWENQAFQHPYDSRLYLAVRVLAVVATPELEGMTCTALPYENGAAVAIWTAIGDTLGEGTASVTVWGTVGFEQRAIGDYGGDPDKEDSETEGVAPYSEFILRQLQRDRGTAYTKEAGTLVDVENVALARFLSATGPRLAEKFRANCVPARSDERLPYWESVLAIPKRFGEPRWRTRQRLASHYRLTEGPNVGSVRTALEGLLGDAFLDMSWEQGADLDNPPTQTFWPGINPGDPSLSLGGGAWSSSRNHLTVQVQLPSDMSVSEFQTLVDVEMFAMLDSLLPATKTFSYTIIDSEGGGFFLDVSRLDFTGMTDG